MAPRAATPRQSVKHDNLIRQRTKEPVLGVTRYDNVRSFMCAIAVALVIGVAYLFILYLSQLEPVVEDRVALELIEIPGGAEDGAIDETLKVDSPEPPSQDAALTDVNSEVAEMEETLDNVIDVADQATSQAPEQFELDYQNTGKTGSATGTGRRPLGNGGDGAGVPREQRWFVRFSDSGTIETYARQLDEFKIHFGLLTPNGQLIFVWNFKEPEKKTFINGKEAKQFLKAKWEHLDPLYSDPLYMTWQGGGRKAADIKLFQKASEDARRGTIFHFYPPNVEQDLARLELGYRNKPVEQIRRTYFVVETEGSGYKFVVTRQTYFD